MISGQTVCKGSDVKSRRGITLRQFWLENNLDHLKCVENNEKTCRWGALLQIYSYRNYTTEITHERKNHPVMCGNVSIRHRIFRVLRAMPDGINTAVGSLLT